MRNGAGSVGSMLAPGSYVTRVDASGNEYLARIDDWHQDVCNDPGCKSCAEEYTPVVLAARQAGGMNDAIKQLETYVRGRLDAIGAPGAKITFAPGPDTFDLDSETVPLSLNERLAGGTITFHTGPKPETAGAVCACRLCKERKASDEKFGRILNGFAPPQSPITSVRTRDEATLEWALQQLDKLCTDLEMGTVSRVDTLLERLQKTWIGVSGGAQ